tara:strand:+ start:1068 stop:1442 length:375 start_codon:yes stop_codon:yes gene_type:complete
MGKTRKKIAQDESRNAIADSKSKSASVRKDGKYEAEQAVKEAAGEKGISMRESNAQHEHNLISMNPLSKHMSTPDFLGGARHSPISNQNKGYASPASMLGDLDKNGVMSEYETKRQTAINENTD